MAFSRFWWAARRRPVAERHGRARMDTDGVRDDLRASLPVRH